MKFTATQTRTRRNPDNGKMITMVKGQTYSDKSVQYRLWADHMVPAGDTITISDDYLLNILLDTASAGDVLTGGYDDVWYQLVGDIGALFCHFRALQIARVGRAYQYATGGDFATLCPDLKAVASDWVN